MNEFIAKVKESGVSELFWIVVGIILGKVIEIIIISVKKKFLRYQMKKRIKKEEGIALESQKILSLDHGDPAYDLHDISIETGDKKLFVECPEDLRAIISRLDPDINFSKNFSFNRGESFEDLAAITAIENLPGLIEKHSRIAAKHFINKLENGHTIFNGRKYGVYRIQRKRNADEDENACLRLDLFETDYFTHQVFRSIYQELKEEGHPISKITKLEDLQSYFPFTTSFGMNTFIIIETPSTDEVIFAKRSKYLNSGSVESKWHVTMNEGLTETDKEGREISLIKCMHRGLREELGIREEHHKSIIDEKFMDLFIEMNKFEIGLTSFVKMDMTMGKLQDLYSVAKDGELETDGLAAIPISERKLNEFIKKETLTEAAKYTLKMYLSRRKYIEK